VWLAFPYVRVKTFSPAVSAKFGREQKIDEEGRLGGREKQRACSVSEIA